MIQSLIIIIFNQTYQKINCYQDKPEQELIQKKFEQLKSQSVNEEASFKIWKSLQCKYNKQTFNIRVDIDQCRVWFNKMPDSIVKLMSEISTSKATKKYCNKKASPFMVAMSIEDFKLKVLIFSHKSEGSRSIDLDLCNSISLKTYSQMNDAQSIKERNITFDQNNLDYLININRFRTEADMINKQIYPNLIPNDSSSKQKILYKMKCNFPMCVFVKDDLKCQAINYDERCTRKRQKNQDEINSNNINTNESIEENNKYNYFNKNNENLNGNEDMFKRFKFHKAFKSATNIKLPEVHSINQNILDSNSMNELAQNSGQYLQKQIEEIDDKKQLDWNEPDHLLIDKLGTYDEDARWQINDHKTLTKWISKQNDSTNNKITKSQEYRFKTKSFIQNHQKSQLKKNKIKNTNTFNNRNMNLKKESNDNNVNEVRLNFDEIVNQYTNYKFIDKKVQINIEENDQLIELDGKDQVFQCSIRELCQFAENFGFQDRIIETKFVPPKYIDSQSEIIKKVNSSFAMKIVTVIIYLCDNSNVNAQQLAFHGYNILSDNCEGYSLESVRGMYELFNYKDMFYKLGFILNYGFNEMRHYWQEQTNIDFWNIFNNDCKLIEKLKIVHLRSQFSKISNVPLSFIRQKQNMNKSVQDMSNNMDVIKYLLLIIDQPNSNMKTIEQQFKFSMKDEYVLEKSRQIEDIEAAFKPIRMNFDIMCHDDDQLSITMSKKEKKLNVINI